jgi:UDP-2,3-diacylglucosamine hydrolase
MVLRGIRLADNVKETLLFSDVHLKPKAYEDNGRKEFIRFLKEIDTERVGRLVCLGDLFDFWFEYKHVVFADYFDVLHQLFTLHEAGVELHLLRGNHDLWAGDQLTQLTGMQVHPDRLRLPFGTKEALLFHGDGMNPDDRRYLWFKRAASNSVLQRLFRCIHPDRAMALAQFLSNLSRRKLKAPNPGKGPEALILQEHARSMIESGQESIIICGHAHAPLIQHIEEGETSGIYINTGDWPLHRSYVRFSGGEFTLHSYC